MDIKIYFLFAIIVLAQSQPLSKNEKSKQELLASKEKIESIEIEDKDNLNRTKKSTKFCIQLCDGSPQCDCASKNGKIENNTVVINVDKNETTEKQEKSLKETSSSDESSEDRETTLNENEENITTENVSENINPDKSTETTTLPINKKKTCKVHGPVWIKADCTNEQSKNSPINCPKCQLSLQNSNEQGDKKIGSTNNNNSPKSDNLVSCNCSSNLLIDPNNPPEERDFDENTYVKYDNENYNKHNKGCITAEETTTTTTKKTIIAKNNKVTTKKIKATKSKSLKDETTTIKPKSCCKDINNSKDVNNRLKKVRIDSLVEKIETINAKVKKLSSSGNLDPPCDGDDDDHSHHHHHHHHHHHKNRYSAKKLSVRSVTDYPAGLIPTTAVENNNYNDNPVSEKLTTNN